MTTSATATTPKWSPSYALAAATIFSGALLLFVVEPLIAKTILPWFGGSAEVWTTCLLFFQAALLGGYLYAHLLTRYVRGTWQSLVHVALLVASLASLPIIPSTHWKPLGGEDPQILILGLLATTIGLPFILLSATNPLVQSWLAAPTARNDGAVRAPYGLFALSNFGSMLALLSYPILIEPNLALRTQATAWSLVYGAFVLLAALTGWLHRPSEAPRPLQTSAASASAPALRTMALWFGLAAAPSALLLAMTNYMLQNIAAIPVFWIVPLALYLLSFVFAFSALRFFFPPLWYGILAISMGALLVPMIAHHGPMAPALLPLFAEVLFVCCIVCHSELALLRPAPRHLTTYYLIISAGGAAGGLFVAVIAPLAFNASYEMLILIPATLLFVLLAASTHYRSWAGQARSFLLLASSLVFLGTVTAALAWVGYRDLGHSLLLARNFYGALRVLEANNGPDNSPLRMLVNGKIMHGEEAVSPGRRREPLSYYSPQSGVGLALEQLGKMGPLKVGVIGLGVGTLAGYGRRGDVYRFYEINPLDVKIAKEQFWYLKLNPAKSDIVLGDGRLSLERELPQRFDMLVVDAFLSDAIPMHLLTREAFALYWEHLKPNGVLAVHISNMYADLAPVVAKAAQASGKTARIIHNEAKSKGAAATNWVLVTSRPDLFGRPALKNNRAVSIPARLNVWTDDYSNIWSVLRF